MTSAMFVDKSRILITIDWVISLCRQSEMRIRDAAVEGEIDDLVLIRDEVERHWPLPERFKAQLKIGPVAAKNIADWNSDLAHALMILHHVLKHDGESIEKLRDVS